MYRGRLPARGVPLRGWLLRGLTLTGYLRAPTLVAAGLVALARIPARGSSRPAATPARRRDGAEQGDGADEHRGDAAELRARQLLAERESHVVLAVREQAPRLS